VYLKNNSLGSLGAEAGLLAFVPKSGKRYSVLMSKPGGFDDLVSKYVFQGKNVLDWYMQFWNQSNSSRFQVTSVHATSDHITVFGLGRGSESFAKLGLDRYWATGKPLRDQFGFRRGVEGIGYIEVVGPDGKNVLESVEVTIPPGETNPIQDPKNETSYPETSQFPYVPVALTGIALTVVVGTVLALRRKKPVTLAQVM
jgi:hypothetical protein